MSNFMIKPGSVKGAASILGNAASEVMGISNEMGNVVEELRRISSSYDIVADNLAVLAQTARTSSQKIGNLETALVAICNAYTNTEDSIVGNITGRNSGYGTNSAAQAANGTTGQVNTQGKQLLDSTSDADKDKLIADFEKNNPYLAKNLDDFLKTGKNNKLTADDIRNIKYLVYSAPEPYRTAYLRNIWRFDIANGDKDGEAYYTPGRIFGRNVTLDYPDSFADDPRGPYTTFFHECGHGIDDTGDMSMPWGYDTQTFTAYSSAMGEDVTVKEAILYDVYENPNNPHSITSMANSIIKSGGAGSNGDINAVIGAFQNGRPDMLSQENRDLYDAIVLEQSLNHNNSAVEMESVSDVYGGVTGNVFRNNYGHSDDYWKNTQNPGRELWAEFYAYNMARDDQALANLKEYFPESYKILEEYANSYQP
ncbi:hypothetical protein NXH67_02260 [Butyrivibrio sp. DSM 10294]|uniref:hypothetical protein n=1 Tax=Butyrivibrio sp. DSM 10294 TaxID=2972457 RepID=UPI00234EF933|nr:hypothetical protein [Butyrivibrio sp. DSM 10294]MDC7292341.1 hypothetical protein [Butyrivibrio sp. DSM 10294]